MGTNFYWKTRATQRVVLPNDSVYDLKIDFSSPLIHIGKRSAAGLYCWDCGETLCSGGSARVHFDGYHWYDKCPKCGKNKTETSLKRSAAGVELGFCKLGDIPHEGINSCCSFSWAQEPEKVKQVCLSGKWRQDVCIEDEYERGLTGDEFILMIKECPIQFTSSIGLDFS